MTLALSTMEASAVSLAGADMAVSASDIGKRIDDRDILSGVTLDVAEGSFIALLGANGAGKSSLLKIFATLMPPSTGDLRLFGRDAGRSAAAIRSRLGLIGHASMLYRDLSLMENLVFFGRLYRIAEPRRRAEELLEYVGLSHRAGDQVKTFSRGMVQRAAIARALMHDPALLLADEPFAGLDAPSAHALEEMLRRLHREGRTIILANHDLSQTLEIAQRAIVLRRGRIVLDQHARALNRADLLREVTVS